MNEYKTGQVLLNDLENENLKPEAVAEGFLYKTTSNMIVGEPGGGKSVILTNLALCLANGHPVFDEFPVSSPQSIYYLVLEGSYYEIIERLKMMKEKIAINVDNLCFDCDESLNVQNIAQADRIIKKIASWKTPDWLFIDPAYMAVRGGLSKDETASAFVQFLERSKREFGCSVFFAHHPTKASYSRDGELIAKEDDFYGSIWIKAHVDFSWRLHYPNKKERFKPVLTNKKARGLKVQEEIPLLFDVETYTCNVLKTPDEMDATSRIRQFLIQCKNAKKHTDTYEVARCAMTSVYRVKHLKAAHLFDDLVNFDNIKGKKTLWIVNGVEL